MGRRPSELGVRRDHVSARRQPERGADLFLAVFGPEGSGEDPDNHG